LPRPTKKHKAEKPARSLEDLLAKVKAQHGAKALSIAGDVEELYTVRHLPVGVAQVDQILGGGMPRGHITEVFGPWSAGKTWLLLNAVAKTQRDGGTAAWLDTEVSFSPGLAKSLGVDLSKLLLSTPENGEEALDLCIALVRQNVDLLVLDSATALAPSKSLDSDVGIDGFAVSVRLWNAGLTRIKPALAFRPTAFTFTNQVRDNVGVMYGPATTEPLGWKSKHDAVLRLEIRRKEWIKRGDQKVGQVSLARIAKSKYDGAIPFAETTFDIHWGSDGTDSDKRTEPSPTSPTRDSGGPNSPAFSRASDRDIESNRKT
jgi:recombination protein RecA